MTSQPRHLDRAKSCFLADIVPARTLTSGLGLLDALDREHTEQDGDPRLHLDPQHTASTTIGHQFIVGGLAPDHGPDAHHGVDSSRCCEQLGGQRYLQAPRYRVLDDSSHSHFIQRPFDPGPQPVDDHRIPSGPDDPNPQTSATQIFGNRCTIISTSHNRSI